MKNKIPQAFFPIVMIIMIGIICIYSIVAGSNTDFGNNKEVGNLYGDFNRQQKQYIKENSTITVYVDSNLRYLMNDDGTGYLWDYMHNVLKPAGISFDFTNDSTEADCYLMVIDDKLRKRTLKQIIQHLCFRLRELYLLKKIRLIWLVSMAS